MVDDYLTERQRLAQQYPGANARELDAVERGSAWARYDALLHPLMRQVAWTAWALFACRVGAESELG